MRLSILDKHWGHALHGRPRQATAVRGLAAPRAGLPRAAAPQLHPRARLRTPAPRASSTLQRRQPRSDPRQPEASRGREARRKPLERGTAGGEKERTPERGRTERKEK
jgi:hypothetical protein